jgi:hypothetical protein
LQFEIIPLCIGSFSENVWINVCHSNEHILCHCCKGMEHTVAGGRFCDCIAFSYAIWRIEAPQNSAFCSKTASEIGHLFCWRAEPGQDIPLFDILRKWQLHQFPLCMTAQGRLSHSRWEMQVIQLSRCRREEKSPHISVNKQGSKSTPSGCLFSGRKVLPYIRTFKTPKS